MAVRSTLLQRASLVMVRGRTTTGCDSGAWNTCKVLGFSSSSSSSPSSAEHAQDKQRREVTVADKSSSSSGGALRKRGGRRPLWRRSPRDFFFPFGFRSDNSSGLFTPPAPSKLGNALLQVSENLNRLLEGLAPSRFFRRFKEDEQCYKLQFEVPGLGKDDIKVTVEDGMLVIRGERKEEQGYEDEDEDEEGWYYASRLR